MGQRMGSADLPLHHGRVPPWLAQRMSQLGRIIVETIVLHYGRDELLRRLAQPFWFQSFGAVMGMDWHSSGITTSVLGALKRGLKPIERDLGLFVCGGRGKHSRKTPDELIRLGDKTGLDGAHLARTSRLVAKVDSAAVQDGFELYLHSFLLAADGQWVVVQQGMNGQTRKARRYHWLSETADDLVEEPHSAIEGENQGEILNLTDKRASDARQAHLELIERGPEAIIQPLRRLRGLPDPRPNLALPHMELPAHHDVRGEDVSMRRLWANLAAAADRGPEDFADLLLTPGIGARTVSSLSLVAEVVHGAPSRFTDPGRFAMAFGGKDGHPFPVPLEVYDQTLNVLRGALEGARLGQRERLDALKRLDHQARLLEGTVEGPDFASFVAQEKRHSRSYGGRTVMDDRRQKPSPRRRPVRNRPKSNRRSENNQLVLPGLSSDGSGSDRS